MEYNLCSNKSVWSVVIFYKCEKLCLSLKKKVLEIKFHFFRSYNINNKEASIAPELLVFWSDILLHHFKNHHKPLPFLCFPIEKIFFPGSSST